jgi:hypothetical protein
MEHDEAGNHKEQINAGVAHGQLTAGAGKKGMIACAGKRAAEPGDSMGKHHADRGYGPQGLDRFETADAQCQGFATNAAFPIAGICANMGCGYDVQTITSLRRIIKRPAGRPDFIQSSRRKVGENALLQIIAVIAPRLARRFSVRWTRRCPI